MSQCIQCGSPDGDEHLYVCVESETETVPSEKRGWKKRIRRETVTEIAPYAVCPDCGKKIMVYGESHTAEIAKEYGITVAQENVERCQSGKLHFLREMSRILGDDAHFVLDVKQAVRAGENPVNMLHMLGSKVCHVHISDHGEKGDCLLLGAGSFRIRSFLEVLYTYSPEASVLLELYRQSYRGISDLVGSYRMLSYMISSIEKKAGEAAEKQ